MGSDGVYHGLYKIGTGALKGMLITNLLITNKNQGTDKGPSLGYSVAIFLEAMVFF